MFKDRNPYHNLEAGATEESYDELFDEKSPWLHGRDENGDQKYRWRLVSGVLLLFLLVSCLVGVLVSNGHPAEGGIPLSNLSALPAAETSETPGPAEMNQPADLQFNLTALVTKEGLDAEEEAALNQLAEEDPETVKELQEIYLTDEAQQKYRGMYGDVSTNPLYPLIPGSDLPQGDLDDFKTTIGLMMDETLEEDKGQPPYPQAPAQQPFIYDYNKGNQAPIGVRTTVGSAGGATSLRPVGPIGDVENKLLKEQNEILEANEKYNGQQANQDQPQDTNQSQDANQDAGDDPSQFADDLMESPL